MTRGAIFLTLLLAHCLSFEGWIYAQFSPQPGTYPQKITLILDESLVNSLSWDGITWSKAPRMLELNGLPGEVRTYKPYFKKNDGTIVQETWIVNRSIGKIPYPLISPGIYGHPLDVQFMGGDEVAKFLIREGSGEWTTTSTPINLSGYKGQSTKYEIKAERQNLQTQDTYAQQWTWIIDRTNEGPLPDRIILESPIPGNFGNQQVLFINREGLAEIRWTQDNSDPKNGVIYNGPLILPPNPDTRPLRVWAKRNDGLVLETSVLYRSEPEGSQFPLQGFIDKSLTVGPLVGFTYTQGEATPGTRSPSLDRAIQLEVEQDTVKPMVLRLFRKTDGKQFRLVYIGQGYKVPKPNPSLEIVGLKSSNESSMVEYILYNQGIEDASYEYQLFEEGEWKPLLGTVLSFSIPMDAYDKLRLLVRGRFGQGTPGEVSNPLTTESSRIGTLNSKPVVWSAWTLAPWETSTWFPHGFPIGDFAVPSQWSGTLSFMTFNPTIKPAIQIRGLDFDTALDFGPQFARIGNTVTIDGGGRPTYFRLLVNDVPESVEFKPYIEPILCPVQVGKNLKYSIEAYTLMTDGTKGVLVTSESIYAHTVAPHAPKLESGPPGTILLPLGKQMLILESTDSGIEYFFRFKEDNTPGPWQKYVQGISIEGGLNSVTTYHLELQARSDINNDLLSGISAYTIIHDQISPPRPIWTIESTRVIQNSSFSLPTTFLEGLEIRIDNGAYLPLIQNFTLDSPEGNTQSWNITLRTRRPSGNVSQESTPLLVTIDKIIPLPPMLEGSLNNSSTQNFYLNKKIDLAFLTESDSKLMRKLSGSDEQPLFIDKNVTIDPPVGGEGSITYQFYQVDAAGNFSEPLTVNLHFDTSPPRLPPVPKIIRAGNSGTVLFEAVSNDEDTVGIWGAWDEENPRELPRELTFQLSPSVPRKLLTYFSMDRAGNTSETSRISLEFKELANTPQVLLQPNTILPGNGSIKVLATSSNVTQRFAIVGTPREVTEEDSVIVAGSIPYTTPNGSILSQYLQVRSWEDGKEPSETISIPFIADNAPPQQVMGNMAPGTYYHDAPQSLSFTSLGDQGSIVFSNTIYQGQLSDAALLKKNLNDQVQGANQNYSGNPIEILVEPNAIKIQIIRAFAKDSVGNISEEISTWTFVSHPSLYFVSPSSGANNTSPRTERGNILSPFPNLETALQDVPSGSTLVLSEGTHQIPPSSIKKNLAILGGFDFQTWETRDTSSTNPTVIYPRGNTAGSFLTIESKIFAIKNVYLLDGASTNAILLDVINGDVQIDGVYFASNRTGTALKSQGGIVRIRKSRFAAQADGGRNLVHSINSELTVDESIFEFVDLPPSLSRRTPAMEYSLLTLENSKTLIQNSRFLPRKGQSTKGIMIIGGVTNFVNTSIGSGSGVLGAIALDTKDATVQFKDLRLESQSDANYSILARLVDSSFQGNNLTMALSARSGAHGILASASRIQISGGSLTATSSSEYTSSFSFNGVAATMDDFEVNLPDSQENIVFRLVGSRLNLNKTKIQSNFTLLGPPIHVLDGSILTMIGSTLRTPSGPGAIYIVPSAQGLSLTNNLFSGVKDVVVERSLGGRYQGIVEERIPSYGRTGGVFTGNQIERGL